MSKVLTVISRAHPAIISTLYGALFFIWVVTSGPPGIPQTWLVLLGDICGVSGLALHLGWAYAACRATALAEENPNLKWPFIGAAASAGVNIAMEWVALAGSALHQLSIVITGAFFFVSLGVAAKAIGRFEGPAIAVGRLFVLFLYLAYLPIGVWFLAPLLNQRSNSS